MVLRKSGRVDSRRFLGVRAKVLREGSRFSFESAFFVSRQPITIESSFCMAIFVLDFFWYGCVNASYWIMSHTIRFAVASNEDGVPMG